MRYLLRAHNQLTKGINTQFRSTKPTSQRNWEKLVDGMKERLQDEGVDEFEGYIELIDTKTREVLHKSSISWA